jgi:hypothetical protein
LTADEQTVSVQVKNDAASPWATLKFHLTTTAAVGAYGPTDTMGNVITLSPQPSGADGYTEYRGTIVPKTAGTYLPAMQFVWNDTDGNGPNSNHQSVIWDIEIFPNKDFPSKTFHASALCAIAQPAISWTVYVNLLTVAAPGETLRTEVMDLNGRMKARLTNKNTVQWKLPAGGEPFVVRAWAGRLESRFMVLGMLTLRKVIDK